MDRGFGRAPANRDDRMYDSFYSDRNRGSSAGSFRNNQGQRGPQQPQHNRSAGGGGQWGGANRERGFFGQGSIGPQDRSGLQGGNFNGQMLATLKQQQHLLSAFMSSQPRNNPPSHHNNRFNQGSNNRNNQNRTPNKSRPDNNKRKTTTATTQGSSANKKSRPRSPPRKAKTEAVKAVEVEVDIPDSEVDIPDSLMDSVEELRRRGDKIERNVADEDVEKLIVFSYTGKGYLCKTCGSLLSTKESFVNHVSGTVHVMKVIESRTKKTYQETRDLLDINLAPDDWYEKSDKARAVILKQAKLIMKVKREKEEFAKTNYNKNPANFFEVSMETRKSARKVGDNVTITSLVESRMEVKEFAGDKFFGCEFVKAVSGFHCRLCDMFIKDSSKVVPHINDKVHRNNYQAHKKKSPNYEKQQQQQNKDLSAILAEEEDKNILLSQTPGIASSPFLMELAPSLVEISKLMDPPPAKEEEAKKTEEVEETKEAEKKEGAAEADAKNETTEKIEKDSETAAVKEDKEESKEDSVEVPMEDEPVENDEKPAEEPTEAVEETAEVETKPADETKEEPTKEEDNEVEEEESQDKGDSKPVKSILKKNAATRKGRGRGRGSPAGARQSRGRSAAKAEAKESEDTESADGSFHVVDEVTEDA